MTSTFQITTADDKQFMVEAENHSRAAIAAAREIHRRRGLTARRTTGSNSMSGYFRAYEPIKGGGLNSVGDAFHVSEV